MKKLLAYPLLSLAMLLSLAGANLFAEEFTFGVVPQFTTQKINDIWSPLLAELSARSGDTYTLTIEPDINEFESAFQRGDYDFAYMNPWHGVVANEAQGYLPIIRDGASTLKGVLVVRADSGINRIEQLERPEIAFPSPNALGASLLMRAELATLHNIEVSPLYVRTHPSVYLNVALGKSIAGGGVMRTLRAQPSAIQEQLKVIHETREISPHPISVHPRVSSEARDRFISAVNQAAASTRGATLFAEVPIQEPAAASLDDYLILRNWNLGDFYVQN
ncbi:MAG: phosphate/phosphite/phosphonate ABC transporter substrate-binding protein [Gammaproteobacteria bacterium]|nr:phosphate/phosphite/phosphonate ABC transporter substrate-binding protein [Gammaproteobacteria bacterium]